MLGSLGPYAIIDRDIVRHADVDRVYGDAKTVKFSVPRAKRWPDTHGNTLLQLRVALPIPDPRGTVQSQEQRNKQEVQAVNNQQQSDAKNSEKAINNAHDKANQQIDSANKGEQWGKDQVKDAQQYAKDNPDSRSTRNKVLSAEKDKITAEKNGEWKKKYAQYQEQQTDVKAIGDFGQKSKDDQTASFNGNGDAKSEAQKAKEKALAGFQKFLQVFEEILSVLTIAFPGAGEVLSVGMRLAEVAGKAAEDVSKIAKGAYKAEKFGEKVRDTLGIKPGAQVIQGVSGKEMADMQNKLINELIGIASKNLGDTAKKVKDTAQPVPQPKLPKCKGPRIQGCSPN